MGDDLCNTLTSEIGNMQPYQKDNLINSWLSAKSVFDNLVNTVWRLDTDIYKLEQPSKYMEQFQKNSFKRYNKLQILSDKIILSNLSTGFRDTSQAPSNECSPGFIQLKYRINESDDTTVFKNNDSNTFEVELIKDTEDTPVSEGSDLTLKVTIDPISISNTAYEHLNQDIKNKKNIRTNRLNRIKGLSLILELNFDIRDCEDSSTGINRLPPIRDGSSIDRKTYWERVVIRNFCTINNAELNDTAIKSKCLKYKAGNYSDNIKDIYNNLIVTGARAKNLIRNDVFDGSCQDRKSVDLNKCLSDNQETLNSDFQECAASLNCAWDGNFQNSVGGIDSTCPSNGTQCLLKSEQTTQTIVDNIEKNIAFHELYTMHQNPYSGEYSEFSDECDAEIINNIESVCKDKNIGISYRFDPISCTPGHPEYNPQTCKPVCNNKDECKSPVLIYEPDLSAFTCSLDGLDKLEKYCKKINDSIINNQNYTNLGLTQEQLQIPGYDPSNYPYTGCNEAVVESHLMYIRSLLMNEIRIINNEINEIIRDDAEFMNRYTESRKERVRKMRSDIVRIHGEIKERYNNVLNVMEDIGRVNNDYNRVKEDVVNFNAELDTKFDKKKGEFKTTVIMSIIIINIILFLFFFGKK
jgi:hypothetical protein